MKRVSASGPSIISGDAYAFIMTLFVQAALPVFALTDALIRVLHGDLFR